MAQVSDWLNRLGMSEYAQRFAENRIDFSVLPELTDQDLEKMGVILGDRRKILRAIAALDRGSPAVPVAAPSPATAPVQPTPLDGPLAKPRAAAGERRYLTVMFCDLVGSTAISAQLDAEEWRDLVGAYLDAATAAVTEMGGHVAKKLGDGLMCLFGYPLAHENDAERAARAALSIQRALAELNRKNAGTSKPELIARIGLESGPAVLDASGEIYGDVANIAARVQALAEPGRTLVTAQVQRQVAGLFVVEERGSHTLKGVPEPTVLFCLVRASGGGRRLGQRNLTPLVGRDEEIAVLMRRWERTRRGEGQLVLIVGEPGLGKSRLIEEFHSGLSETPHTWVEWSCSQLLQNTPLHPIAEWGRQRFGGADTPAEQRLAELENSLAQVKLDPAESVPLLAPLLDIPLPMERVSTLAPEELRRRRLAALTNWVMAGTKTQPLVLAFEDLHWADPTTLDVLRSVAERGASVPLCIVATTRPEFRPPWDMRSHHGTISLAPLDRAQVRDMVGELAARHALSREVIDDVAARTGGVPLFVEEVTRLLLERGEQGGAQVIPPTLQQSLMARLDRLGPAREVAQVGSVIGRGFSYKLLKAVAGMDDAPLEAALEKLSDADIVLVEGTLPESDYRFKHALIQDAAYENLLKSRRQVLHRRVAEILRHQFAVRAGAEPELLAHHFTQAAMPEVAIEWWGKAGQRSQERSALVEAAEQITRALNLIAALSSSPALRREEIKLQVALIAPLIHVKGYAAPETKAAAERARLLIEQADALGEHPEDPLLLFSVLYGFWVASHVSFDGERMVNLAEQFLSLAEKQGQAVPLMIGRRLMAVSMLSTGRIAEARVYFDQALALYDPAGHRPLAIRFGQDVGIAILSLRAWALWLLGYPEAALADIDQAVKDAQSIGHAATIAYSLLHATIVHCYCGEYATATMEADELATLAEDKGTAFWKMRGAINKGFVMAIKGQAADAARTISLGIGTYRATGSTLWTPLSLGLLAKSHAELNRHQEASCCIDEALALVETTQERWCAAEIERLAGETALMGRNAAKAQAYFERAISTAHQQQAKSWELRATISLAGLWRDQGQVQRARELLSPVYDWFSEGFGTRDLKEAKALLNELAA
jgi:class 3 adenylate cyclase/tetratricopeptide (TPR) repeat protein